MKKLFLSFFFILSFICFFSITSYAQIVEPTPITVDANTATETVVTGNEFSLGRLTIDVHPDGFAASRITVVASIGVRKVETDPITGFKLFTKVGEMEIFSGTLAAYSQELDIAVNNTVITNEQKTTIMNGLLDIYTRCFDGFKTTATILQANGKLELKAKKIAE